MSSMEFFTFPLVYQVRHLKPKRKTALLTLVREDKVFSIPNWSLADAPLAGRIAKLDQTAPAFRDGIQAAIQKYQDVHGTRFLPQFANSLYEQIASSFDAEFRIARCTDGMVRLMVAADTAMVPSNSQVHEEIRGETDRHAQMLLLGGALSYTDIIGELKRTAEGLEDILSSNKPAVGDRQRNLVRRMALIEGKPWVPYADVAPFFRPQWRVQGDLLLNSEINLNKLPIGLLMTVSIGTEDGFERYPRDRQMQRVGHAPWLSYATPEQVATAMDATTDGMGYRHRRGHTDILALASSEVIYPEAFKLDEPWTIGLQRSCHYLMAQGSSLRFDNLTAAELSQLARLKTAMQDWPEQRDPMVAKAAMSVSRALHAGNATHFSGPADRITEAFNSMKTIRPLASLESRLGLAIPQLEDIQPRAA